MFNEFGCDGHDDGGDDDDDDNDDDGDDDGILSYCVGSVVKIRHINVSYFDGVFFQH